VCVTSAPWQTLVYAFLSPCPVVIMGLPILLFKCSSTAMLALGRVIRSMLARACAITAAAAADSSCTVIAEYRTSHEMEVYSLVAIAERAK